MLKIVGRCTLRGRTAGVVPPARADESETARIERPLLPASHERRYMSNPLPSKKTLALSVNNMGFMIDRMGRDCTPLQFLRELTQNSIEAILRCFATEGDEEGGEIRWDVDWNRFDLLGDG